VTRKKREALTPPDVIVELLQVAGDGLVLVGGQALAVWTDYYALASAVEEDLPSISNDVDFLTESAADKDAVTRLARALAGKAIFPPERALTPLVGQAVRDVSDEEVLNVDVIFKVLGLDAKHIWKNAVPFIRRGRAPFLVMHPLDVLASRLTNIYKLKEKQDAKGEMQLALSVEVARAFLREQASKTNPAETASGRSSIQQFVSRIEKLAKDDAGRKVARRHRIHVADAIDPLLIPPGPFWERRWPTLRELMSPAYRKSIKPPRAKG
jgi:hypothetical protein